MMASISTTISSLLITKDADPFADGIIVCDAETEDHHPTVDDVAVAVIDDSFAADDGIIDVCVDDIPTVDVVVDPFADGIICVCADEPADDDDDDINSKGTTTDSMTTNKTKTNAVLSYSEDDDDEEEENNNKIIEYPDGHNQLILKVGGGGFGGRGADGGGGGGGSLDSSSSSSSTGHTCANTTVEEEDSSSSSLSLSSSSSSSHNEGKNHDVATDQKKKEENKEDDVQEFLKLNDECVEVGIVLVDACPPPPPPPVDDKTDPLVDAISPHVDDYNEHVVDIATAAIAIDFVKERGGDVEVEAGSKTVVHVVADAPEEEVEEEDKSNNTVLGPPSSSSTIKTNNDKDQQAVVDADTAPDVDVSANVAAAAAEEDEHVEEEHAVVEEESKAVLLVAEYKPMDEEEEDDNKNAPTSKPNEEGVVVSKVATEENKKNIPSTAEQMVSLLWASSSKSNTTTSPTSCSSTEEVDDLFIEGDDVMVVQNKEEEEEEDNEIVEEIIDGEDNAIKGKLLSTTIENIADVNFENDGDDDDGSIEEITIVDEVEEYNDDEDGMSVSTAGEFFETTAHIEVSSDLLKTTTNNGNDDHHGDGRSYDEITADDWELYDENTIDDVYVDDDDADDEDADEDDNDNDVPDRVVNDNDVVVLDVDDTPEENSNSNPGINGMEGIVVDTVLAAAAPSVDDDTHVDVPAKDGREEEEEEEVVLVVEDAPTEGEEHKCNNTLLALPLPPSTIKTHNDNEQTVDHTPPHVDSAPDDDAFVDADVAAAAPSVDDDTPVDVVEEEEDEKVVLVVQDAPMEEEEEDNTLLALPLPPSTNKTKNDNEQAADDTPHHFDSGPDDDVAAAAPSVDDDDDDEEEGKLVPLVENSTEDDTNNTLEKQPSIKMTNDVDHEKEAAADEPKQSMTMRIEKKNSDELQVVDGEEVTHDRENDDDDQQQKEVLVETTVTTATDDVLSFPCSSTSTMSFAERMKKMFDSSTPDEPSMAFGNSSKNKSIVIAHPTCIPAVQKEEGVEEGMVVDSTTGSTTTFSTPSAYTDNHNDTNNTNVQENHENEKMNDEVVVVPTVVEEKEIPSAAEQMVSLLWASSSKSKTKVPDESNASNASTTTTISCSSTEVVSSNGENDTIVLLDSSIDLVKSDDPVVVAEEEVTASQKEYIDEDRIVRDEDESEPVTAAVDATTFPTIPQSKQKDGVVDLPVVSNSTKKGKLADRLKMFDSPANSKSNSSNIPRAFTNKQPSWRKEKASTIVSKAVGTNKKSVVVVNTTSQEQKVTGDIEKASPSASGAVCHDKDLLVERIVSLLIEPGCMRNTKLLAQRIVSLLGGDDIVICDMMVKSVKVTTNGTDAPADSLNTTTHSYHSRSDGGSPKTATMKKKPTVRTSSYNDEVETDANKYILRKKDGFKDIGLKKMRNTVLIQKEKLRHCDDPDTILIRKMKRVSTKELKLKKKTEDEEDNQQQQAFIASCHTSSPMVEGKVTEQQQQKPEADGNNSNSNNNNDALLAEQVIARIWPKDKVRQSPSSKVLNFHTPSTKKLGDRLKMFDCPLPEASSSPSSWSSSPRSTSSFKSSSPMNNNKTTPTTMSNTPTSSKQMDDIATTSSITTEKVDGTGTTDNEIISKDTLKKLSSFQRLWRKINNKSKKNKNTSAIKDCGGSVSSFSSSSSKVSNVPSTDSPTFVSKPMTSSPPHTPTTTNTKKKNSLSSIVIGAIVGSIDNCNEEGNNYTLDDFEQKRHVDLDNKNKIDMDKWECYLYDEEFYNNFNGLTKGEFYLQPKWKRDKQKRKVRVAF